jgi:hypothetical protein
VTKWLIPLWWLALALVLVVPAPTRADEERGYLGGAPVDDWLALWTSDGVYAVQLGSGCDGVRAGLNVLIDGDELRVIDPLLGVQDQACQLTVRDKRGDVPCATNPDGVCDVAWTR